MQQIKLTEFTESYAVSVDHALPENEAVFFKTRDGRYFKGECFTEGIFLYEYFFDNLEGEIFSALDVISWHPVTVDM